MGARESPHAVCLKERERETDGAKELTSERERERERENEGEKEREKTNEDDKPLNFPLSALGQLLWCVKALFSLI